jgi:hypothetical protein
MYIIGIVVIKYNMVVASPLSVDGKATRRIDVELALCRRDHNGNSCPGGVPNIADRERTLGVLDSGRAGGLDALSAGVKMPLCRSQGGGRSLADHVYVNGQGGEDVGSQCSQKSCHGG